MMSDPIFSLIEQEEKRQQETLMLIPSENYASRAVRQAVGSVLGNKYSEGYAGKRYYEGNEVIDQIELLAIKRAKSLFGVPHANVQPYSGSPANSAILFALANPGDAIMGLSLASGGHLTHGHPRVTFSGKYYQSIQFGLDSHQRIDMEECARLARASKPKVIIVGTTAYPFILDFEGFAKIAKEVDAYLVADISHIAGLVVAGVHPSPAKSAHVIMTTTHKTLRGPRGAMILVTDIGLAKDQDLGKKVDAAVFPGLQGGPHNHTTAGIAVALGEAGTPEFITYNRAIVENAQVLAKALQSHGIRLVGGGTQNHLMILDFSQSGVGKGALVAMAMNTAGLVSNKNTVPGDELPFFPSGVRIGTPGVTTRGMGSVEMDQIAAWIAKIVKHLESESLPTQKQARIAKLADFKQRMEKDSLLLQIAKEVKALCAKFPVDP